MTIYRAIVFLEETRELSFGERVKVRGPRFDMEHRVELIGTFMGEDIRCFAASRPDRLASRIARSAGDIELKFRSKPTAIREVPKGIAS